MRRFLLLALALLALLAAAQARTPRLRKLQEEGEAGQGNEDGVDVDKSLKLPAAANPPHFHRALAPKKPADDDHGDDHTGHDHRTLAEKDDHGDHAGHDTHEGHNHMMAAEQQQEEGDKQPADPRAGLCKMPGQSPCPNGPGTCTLLFCDCNGMQNCRYIDPPKLL